MTSSSENGWLCLEGLSCVAFQAFASQCCYSETNSPNSPFKEFVCVYRCTLARTSWRWCWWWCTYKLGVCTKSLVAFEIWWALLDTPQLGIPSNSLFDRKVPTWNLEHPTPTHREMKESYLRLSHQHVTAKWIVLEDDYLWFCCFHWPPCPLNMQITLDRIFQVQDITLVAVVVGASGVGGANDVWKKKLNCCRCYQLQGTLSLYG